MGTSKLKSTGFRALLTTQFLGAFNDNAFKLVIQLMAINVIISRSRESGDAFYVALAMAFFTLPFILFSTYAGYLADRFSKQRIMMWIKVAEIAIMVVGGLTLMTHHVPLMIVMLFLMGAQSAFFSPPKYGILPELLPDEELSRGNGQIQLWTFLAIIIGTAVGGQLTYFFKDTIYVAALFFVAVALAGTAASLKITHVNAAGSKRRFEPIFFRDAFATLREIVDDRPLFLCVLGCAYFWFLGALFHMNILLYAKRLMGLNDMLTGLLVTAVALGIGLGSALAGRWSGQKIELGLVPFGAIGMAFFAMMLGFSSGSYALTISFIFMLGVFGAFYSIPLNAYVQQKSPRQGKGRVLAALNFITNVGIVLSALLFWFIQDILGVNSAWTFIVLGLASIAAVVFICRTVPDFFVRFLIWLFTHTVYRIRLAGRENIPKEKGALLVCNHISFADAFLVQACTQRVIRFVMARSFYDQFLLRPFCRAMKAIPVSPDDRPKKLLASLRVASQALQDGDVVCLFAEGAITRTGNMLTFSKGLERIMKGVDAPVIPVYIDRMWGSIFSFEGGRILNRLPTRLPYPATISFGAPLASDTTAYDARIAVEELGAEAFKYRKNELELLSSRFYKMARRHPLRFCMADSSGRKLSYSKALIGSAAFARAIRRTCEFDNMIGVLLPNSVPAALVNVGITILGRIPVNLNYTTSTEALTAAIRKCELKHIFTSREFLDKAGIAEQEGMIFLEDFANQVTRRDKQLAALGFWLLPHGLLRWLYRREHRRRIDSPATVIFSSGSTGDPKGVMLSHANIHANIEGIYQVIKLRKEDVVLGILPFFHSFGFTGTLWLPLTTGMGVAYHSNPLDFKRVGEMAQQHSASLLTATPTFLSGYIRKCTPEQFASLRLVIVGAEKLKQRLAQAFEKRFGIEPYEGYGCTELSPIVAVNVPDEVHGSKVQVGHKPGTIGHPLPGVAAKTVDPDTYEPKGPEEEGLLLVKGPNVMLGYLNDSERTEQVMNGEWYVTGDMAAIGRDGFITITDRLSRFSKIGGEMVPHLRIEEKIQTVLGATTEQRCAVTSVPDERKGERLAVLCHADVDIDELCRKLTASDLPNLWIPRREAFIPVNEIPLLGSGKLDLKKIRAMAAEALQSNTNKNAEG